jgi:hypothetical protein
MGRAGRWRANIKTFVWRHPFSCGHGLVRDYGTKKHLFGVIQQDHTEPPADSWGRMPGTAAVMKENGIML